MFTAEEMRQPNVKIMESLPHPEKIYTQISGFPKVGAKELVDN